jgi:hypothetical protein
VVHLNLRTYTSCVSILAHELALLRVWKVLRKLQNNNNDNRDQLLLRTGQQPECETSVCAGHSKIPRCLWILGSYFMYFKKRFIHSCSFSTLSSTTAAIRPRSTAIQRQLIRRESGAALRESGAGRTALAEEVNFTENITLIFESWLFYNCGHSSYNKDRGK